VHDTRPGSDHPTGDTADALVQTGIPGLDAVLGGGLTPHCLYLVEGAPGSGKTTIAMQFLMAGAAQGEAALYVTLSETARELAGVARAHGWNLQGVHIREMLPTSDTLEPEEQYTMFHPSEVELGETTLRILADVESIRPTRVVFDSLSELRLLANSSLRYRRQILALKQFFMGRSCTVLLLDDMQAAGNDLQVQSIAHAVLRLEQLHPDYGAMRRRLTVAKFRGRDYRGGFHDYKIARGGLEVYPRLVAAQLAPAGTEPAAQTRTPSGLTALDLLLGGGLERGTSTLFMGAPGTGKSTLTAQFALAAAERGECTAMFLFDESANTLRTRCAGMGMDLSAHIDAGLIRVRQIDPAELSPGEFVQLICDAVDVHAARFIVIDSLNGYLNAMPDERFLIVQLHELLRYLGQRGVITLLVGAQHGLVGTDMRSSVDASYLADAVVLLRYFEAEGEVRQAISVLKKRCGMHERAIREFSMSGGGLHIGEPLRHFQGILTGIPTPTPRPQTEP
jgi:circadian clock protein KaiC